MSGFKLAEPFIDTSLNYTYTTEHILPDGKKKSTNYRDYRAFFEMDRHADFAVYAAVNGKQEACTIESDDALRSAFYRSRLLISTVDELVRVIKAVHIPDEEYDHGRPGVPFQKFGASRDRTRKILIGAWGAILNKNSLVYLNSTTNRLLVMIPTEFWTDVLDYCKTSDGRSRMNKDWFLDILLTYNDAWNHAIVDPVRRKTLLERCLNISLRWFRFKCLWSSTPANVEETDLPVEFGLFTRNEYDNILAKMPIPKDNDFLNRKRLAALKRLNPDSNWDDELEVQGDAKSESVARKRAKKEHEAKKQRSESEQGAHPPAPGPAPAPTPGASLAECDESAVQAVGDFSAGSVTEFFKRRREEASAVPDSADSTSAAKGPAGRPRVDLPAAHSVGEHLFNGGHYNFEDVSLTRDKLLRDAIRKSQQDDPYSLLMYTRDEAGKEALVDVQVITRALEGLLLRDDLPQVRDKIEHIAMNLAHGFQENVEKIAEEMAKEAIDATKLSCERRVRLIEEQKAKEIADIKRRSKEELEHNTLAVIKMRREFLARQYYKRNPTDPLPEGMVSTTDAAIDIKDKALRDQIKNDIESDLGVDSKIALHQRYMEEVISLKDRETAQWHRLQDEYAQTKKNIEQDLKQLRQEDLALRQQIDRLKTERDALEKIKDVSLQSVAQMREKMDDLTKNKLLKQARDCQLGEVFGESMEKQYHTVSDFTRARVLQWLEQDSIPLCRAALEHAVQGTVFSVAALESMGESPPADTAPLDSDVAQPGLSLLEDTRAYNRRVLWHQQSILESALEFNADFLCMKHDLFEPREQWKVIANDMNSLKTDMLSKLQTVKQTLTDMEGFMSVDNDMVDKINRSGKLRDTIEQFSVLHGEKLAELTKEAGCVFEAISRHMERFNEKHSEILVQSGVSRAVKDAHVKYTAAQKVLQAKVDETKARGYKDTNDEPCNFGMLFARLESLIEDITQQIVLCKESKNLPDVTQLTFRYDQLAACMASLRLVVHGLSR
jgi:hypothetical protein